jgi:hypothetical protein
MSRIEDWSDVIRTKQAFDAQDAFIDECTIDELVTFAQEMNIHFEIQDDTSARYIDRVARIKTRLTDAGIDPDTVRNEYWDNMNLNE